MDPRVLIDTERVIAEVRSRPQIWLATHSQYKSRDSRMHAWNEIARTLVPNLYDFSRADQNDIEKRIQQRWRTARDSFVKARAQQLEGAAGGSSGKERNYGYYESLRFLEPTLRAPARACATSPAPAPAPAALPRRRRVLRARPLLALSARRTPLDEDDDNFFRSLAPMLRELSTEQKLAFRSRVLALALTLQAAPERLLPDSRYRGPDPLSPDTDGDDEDALETKYRPPSSPDTPHAPHARR